MHHPTPLRKEEFLFYQHSDQVVKVFYYLIAALIK